jgi:subtilisin family serine protease
MKNKLGPALTQRLAEGDPNDPLEVQIFFRQNPSAELSAMAEETGVPNRTTMVREARESLQRDVDKFLGKLAPHSVLADNLEGESKPLRFRELRRNWINNSIAAVVSRDSLATILGNPNVERVNLVARADLKDLLHPSTELLLDDPPSLATPTTARQVEIVGAPHLWSRGLRGTGVLVAVIDSGIDFNHPDLRKRAWNGGSTFPSHGFNFESPARAPRDRIGHGTSCAGLIAGDGSLQLTTGVAPGAKLMALRVGGVESHVWSAFEFAIENGADVISMSMGWSAERKPNYIGWRRACDFILRAGVVFVCSAGNEGQMGQEFDIPYNIAAPAICPPPWLHPAQKPGGLSAAISCGETNLMDEPEPESSRGPGAWEAAPFTDYPLHEGSQALLKPDICAPGRGGMTCNMRFSAHPAEGPHIPFGGTSASAAVVAGCISLLVNATKSSGKPVRPQRIQQALEETAVPIQGQTTKQNNLGSGRVDVFAAYKYGVQQGWWQ